MSASGAIECGPAPAPRCSPRRVWAAAALLLALYAALALGASLRKSASFDEGEEIALGYNLWLRHDFRMEGANGDLVKRWSSLPLLLIHPALPPPTDPYLRRGRPYGFAFQFLYTSGNDPAKILLAARSMHLLLGVGTGLLVFLCSRRLFGDGGGLVSLAAFAFSPSMLAFGALVSTEMPVCLTLLGSAVFVWKLLQRVTLPRLLASLAWAGLLALSKLSVLLMLPIGALLVGIAVAGEEPMRWNLFAERTVRSRRGRLAVAAALLLAHMLFAWVCIWADYEFRYAASPNPADPGLALQTLRYADPIDPGVEAFVTWCRRVHFLPQGYLQGVELLLGSNDLRGAFMDGRWTLGGWWTFFPFAFWVKTPPAFLLLLAGGAALWVRGRRRGLPGIPAFKDATPFAVLVLVYMGAAMLQRVDIGHRHILPLYPALYVLAGSAALAWGHRRVWVRACVLALLAWGAADCCAVYPDYLAYFSPWAGGPDKGYLRLVDSSLDWGMDLPGLRDWVRGQPAEKRDPLYLAYFGTGDPDSYGLRFRWLASDPNWRPHHSFPLEPGLYAISATLFESVGTRTFGPWNAGYEGAYQAYAHLLAQGGANPLCRLPANLTLKQAEQVEALRFGRLCAWLRRHRPPDTEVGHSILIWRLDADDLRAALLGPPAELGTPVLAAGAG